MPVPVFRVSFWDRDKRTWKTFEVECPRLESISAYADCITSKLADGYEEAVYRNCLRTVDEPDMCRSIARHMRENYYRALLPVVEAFLELEPLRRQTKDFLKATIRINDDVLAMLNKRMVVAVRAAAMRAEGRPVRLGMSFRSLVAFDFDSRKYEALKEALVLALWLCRNYAAPSIIYPTMRGFHLVSLRPFNKKTWETIYNTVAAMANEGRLKYVDKLHITMSLARGYATVSVARGRDIHYLVDAVTSPEDEDRVLGCRLWYSPIAIYKERVASDFWDAFDEIRPLVSNELYRRLRESWIKTLQMLNP